MLKLYSNTGTDATPTFDGGTFLQVGPSGSKVDIDVGSRATPQVADWNNDGRKDLVVGALDGRIHLFLNTGTDTSPDFTTEAFVQDSGEDLYVPSLRSSPVVTDVSGDGRKDLLSGNTNGELLLYLNVGSDAAPTFSGYSYVTTDGVPIDLNSLGRSRPSVCDWTGDGRLDFVIGVGDGQVHLFEGKTYVPALSVLGLTGTVMMILVTSVLLIRRRSSRLPSGDYCSSCDN